MRKIGITIAHLDRLNERIFINGISQNIIFFYNYMSKLENIDFYLVSNELNSNFKSIKISNTVLLDFFICGGLILDVHFKNL